MGVLSAAISAGSKPLFQTSAILLPDRVSMDGPAQLINDGAVGRRERGTRVIRKERPFLRFYDPCLLEPGEVAAQVGLVQLQDGFQITDAERPLMEKIENTQPVGISKSFQDFGYVHEHRVM